MKFLNFPDDLEGLRGTWETSPDIKISNITRRDIYRPPIEPGFVCWSILWKERGGTLKLSFAEASGDPTAWPPVMDFTARDISYYLKTLVSEDGGQTWTDTGWREDLDPLWQRNSDHHIRHVFELSDGRLMRNYCHCVKGVTAKLPHILYDRKKEGRVGFSFTTTADIYDLHVKFGSITYLKPRRLTGTGSVIESGGGTPCTNIGNSLTGVLVSDPPMACGGLRS